jgi:predicted Zn-dependent protease
MSMKKQGALKKARRLLAELLDDDPDRGAFIIEETLIDSEQGNFSKAQDRLQAMYNRFPGNIVISTYLLRALLADGTRESAERAIPIIREQLLVRDNDPSIYDLYAQAANRAERPIKTAEAVAEAHYLRGQLHQAVMKLREVSRQTDLDYYQRARISARLAELEIELAEGGQRLQKTQRS